MPVLWQRQCEVSAAARRENGVLPDLILPSRSLSYAMIMQGECSSKVGKRSFTRLDTAEPQPVICNDNANEGNESLLSYCRVQLIIYNDSASEGI